METFETSRLLMRPLCLEDQAFYCACYTDPILMRHIREPLSHEEALKSFKATLNMNANTNMNRRTWFMREIDSNTAVGLIALIRRDHAVNIVEGEIGSIIVDDFHNKGYAAEAINHLVNIAFHRGPFTDLKTHHTAQNIAANGLMKKLGFQRNITTTHALQIYSWVLSKQAWQKRTSQIQTE
jgi:RimJ/RimL family protein N-acetyltransferase